MSGKVQTNHRQMQIIGAWLLSQAPKTLALTAKETKMKKILFFLIIAVVAINSSNVFADCTFGDCSGDNLAAESSASSQIYFFNGSSGGENNEINRVMGNYHQQASPYLGYPARAVHNNQEASAWTKIRYWRYDQLTHGLSNVEKLWKKSDDTKPQSLANPTYIPSNTDGIFLLDEIPNWDIPVLGAFWSETASNAMELEAIRRILSLSKTVTNTRYVYLTSVRWVDMANSLNALATSAGLGRLWSKLSGGISMATDASTTRARGFTGWVTVAICFADIPGYTIPGKTKTINSTPPTQSSYIARIDYGQKGADNINSAKLVEEIKSAIAKGIRLEVIGYDINGQAKAKNQATRLTAKIVDQLPWETEALIRDYFFINSFELNDEKEKKNLLKKNLSGYILIKQLKS